MGISGRADDIDKAIGDSIKLCVDVLDGKTKAVEMRGEQKFQRGLEI